MGIIEPGDVVGDVVEAESSLSKVSQAEFQSGFGPRAHTVHLEQLCSIERKANATGLYNPACVTAFKEFTLWPL